MCLCGNDRLTQDQRGFGAALVRKISDKGLRYLTPDDELTLLSAREDPVGMIRSLDRAVIDEIQRNDAAGGGHLGCTALDLVGNVEETQKAQQSQTTLRDWQQNAFAQGGAKPGPIHEQVGRAAQRPRAGSVGHGEPFPCHSGHGHVQKALAAPDRLDAADAALDQH